MFSMSFIKKVNDRNSCTIPFFSQRWQAFLSVTLEVQGSPISVDCMAVNKTDADSTSAALRINFLPHEKNVSFHDVTL